MTVSVRAFFLTPPEVGMLGSVGFTGQVGGAMHPETPPSILWGQGTPNGDLPPFNLVNKGSLYMCVNNTDDSGHLYHKVDEGGDDADWVLYETLPTRRIVTGPVMNLDNAGTEDFVIFAPGVAVTIVTARLVFTEATDASGAAEGAVTVGTAVNGEQIVASVALAVSKAIGSFQELTIVSGTVAADGFATVRIDGYATTEAGEAFLQLEYTVD